MNHALLRMLNVPNDLDAPEEVAGALALQDRAFELLLDHLDEREDVLAGDWIERAEKEMQRTAKDGTAQDLITPRRVERAGALAKRSELERAVRKAADAARKTVTAWLHDGGAEQIRQAAADAHAEELAALDAFLAARSKWMAAAGCAQWASAAARAANPAAIPDHAGRPLNGSGGAVNATELDRVHEHVQLEFDRADHLIKPPQELPAELTAAGRR